MDRFLKKLSESIEHLDVLHKTFHNSGNFGKQSQLVDYELYTESVGKMNAAFSEINAFDELYRHDKRQMILADVIEYMLLGRAFHSMWGRNASKRLIKKGKFIEGTLHFVNMLMCYEAMTVNVKLRKKYLRELSDGVTGIAKEALFKKLMHHSGSIGLPNDGVNKKLTKYFDKMLPKTAGGLWHELLVYVFLLRNDLGYVLPLLLHQRIFSKSAHLVPPDFLLLTSDRHIYGIEVGRKRDPIRIIFVENSHPYGHSRHDQFQEF